jgi:hypothetical protein
MWALNGSRYIHRMKHVLTFVLCVLCAHVCSAQTVIVAKGAKAHIGETVTVTDKVFGGKLLSSNMTLIDLGGYYPNELLTIMIPPASRDKFPGKPEIDWKGKVVTVTGKIIDYKGKPEIIVSDAGEIKISQ